MKCNCMLTFKLLMWIKRDRLIYLVLLLGSLGLAQCAWIPGYKPQTVFTKVVLFKITAHANRDQSFGLDLVAVDNEKLLEKLLAMPAKDWFAKREQLKLDFPADLHTWEWEATPGQQLPLFKLPSRARNAVGLLLFAQYVTEGAHRARLDPYEIVLVQLEKQKMVIRKAL